MSARRGLPFLAISRNDPHVVGWSRERDDGVPALSRRQAQALVAGLILNVLGGVVLFWSMPHDWSLPVGWGLVAAGFAVALLGGAHRFVPRYPREVLATARVAGLPARSTTVLIFGLLALALAGGVHAFLTQPL
jgi:hypothetical protein